MSSPAQVLKSVGPKLVPFFKSVSVYFILLAEQPSLLTACFKCLPIISLIVFVLLHGISLSQEYRFSRRILTGLIFSCIGDALLVWPSCFTPGMCMFALAQIMYISAFGFIPLNIMLGTILYALCSLVIYALMPGLNGILVIGVPVYTVLLTTMAWRAISRVQFYKVQRKELWTWTKLCSCIGSICFLISDTLLGFHYFHTPLPYSQVSIMLTYYAAQLGIALSAVGSKNSNNNNNNNVSNDKTDTALVKG
ncbi:lysoplasmalogenase-like protein TMEM86A isoform X1 [Bombus affinis]|uniref:lysoplasmalogenase n=1 Tax=Bombus terrestris TaxID=30195 RepID=A0A9B2JY91_BOMTE|nr:lysoplasmalogenase-like protein TMEM86A isoform X1 [Bombus terrestris]XP_050597744.1 lysoplasmalogenase-like protein TMEM86A isoform X1 [Bombus affinis]